MGIKSYILYERFIIHNSKLLEMTIICEQLGI